MLSVAQVDRERCLSAPRTARADRAGGHLVSGLLLVAFWDGKMLQRAAESRF